METLKRFTRRNGNLRPDSGNTELGRYLPASLVSSSFIHNKLRAKPRLASQSNDPAVSLPSHGPLTASRRY
jgi:hypothetical protein